MTRGMMNFKIFTVFNDVLILDSLFDSDLSQSLGKVIVCKIATFRTVIKFKIIDCLSAKN